MDRLLSAMAIFIEYPLLAAIIGVLLLVLGRATRRRTAVAVGWLWLLYSLYETGMHRRWSVAVSVTFGLTCWPSIRCCSSRRSRLPSACFEDRGDYPRRLEERVAA